MIEKIKNRTVVVFHNIWLIIVVISNLFKNWAKNFFYRIFRRSGKMNEKKRELYFIHEYYSSNTNKLIKGIDEDIRPDRMVLLKDSFQIPYNVSVIDINTNQMYADALISEGEYVYYEDGICHLSEDNSVSQMYGALNKELSSSIRFKSSANQPDEIKKEVKEVYSYHVNIGHGNCSIVVFRYKKKWMMWMVDCSILDMITKKYYKNNLMDCLCEIKEKYQVEKISKLLITHLHYDHINGIEFLIDKHYIDKNTEVWMNTQYPWKMKTYNRILIKLIDLGVRFIDPDVHNSTTNINIIYPENSFNLNNKAPKNRINNSSVLYQICFNNEKMLFTGDIEIEGWNQVNRCLPSLQDSTYYCIAHHGSITGHIRSKCKYKHVRTLADCASDTKAQILMGRDGAYSGLYSKKVLNDFENILDVGNKNIKYYKIDWGKNIVSYVDLDGQCVFEESKK